MSKYFNTFSTRAFSISGYDAPLYVHMLDSDINKSELQLQKLMQGLLSINNRKIVTYSKWAEISCIAQNLLETKHFWKKLTRNDKNISSSVFDFYRFETLRSIAALNQDLSLFAYQTLSNILYQSSIGFGVDNDYGLSTITRSRFSNILLKEMIDITEHDDKISFDKDDLLIWHNVTNMIICNASQPFKQQFKSLLSYEISYGLSPSTKSETLETLIKNSKSIAIVPMISGINSISTALVNENWIVALKATATTGAVVLGLLSTIALSDVIIRWLKQRELN